VTLAHAVARRWDVVVVGAGPAGAIAAREAACRGLAVLLVDHVLFPRPKVCGCCLSAAALGVLETIGLGGVPTRLGARPLSLFQWAAGRQRASLPLPTGAALSRALLDAALVGEAVRRGVAFLPGVLATVDPDRRFIRRVILRQGEASVSVDTRVVVVADGLGGSALSRHRGFDSIAHPASRLGAAAIAEQAPGWYRPGTIFMACGPGGYVGLVRLEDGRLNLAAALDPARVRQTGGVGAVVAQILRQADFPAIDARSALVWRGTPALTRRRARVADDRLFVIGDAAGYVEPFTGEGMAWAMASAVAVTPLVCEAAAQWTPSLAAQWTSRHRRLVRRRQATCRWITQALRDPRLAQTLVGAAARLPGVAIPVVRGLQAPLAECLV